MISSCMACSHGYTIYGNIFKWDNFCGWSAKMESCGRAYTGLCAYTNNLVLLFNKATDKYHNNIEEKILD